MNYLVAFKERRRTNLLKVDLDLSNLEKVISESITKALEKHSFYNNLPPLLTKSQLMELLDIGATKAAELLNREDFPVIREFGHPRVPTHLFMKWIDEHTEWVHSNATIKFSKRIGA
jgi:hypothetical protein